MEYLCAKFGDFGLSRVGFIVRKDTPTDRRNHRITEEDRYTHATTVGVSKDNYFTTEHGRSQRGSWCSRTPNLENEK